KRESIHVRQITKPILNDRSSSACERQDHPGQWNGDRSRWPIRSSSRAGLLRHSTTNDPHRPRLFINSLKTRGAGAQALITMAFRNFEPEIPATQDYFDQNHVDLP